MEIPPSPAEASHLRRLRLRRLALAGVFLALPLVLLVRSSLPSASRDGVLMAWVVFYAVAMMATAWSRCPRCGQLFFSNPRWFRVDPFRSRCGGCRLPLREEGPRR